MNRRMSKSTIVAAIATSTVMGTGPAVIILAAKGQLYFPVFFYAFGIGGIIFTIVLVGIYPRAYALPVIGGYLVGCGVAWVSAIFSGLHMTLLPFLMLISGILVDLVGIRTRPKE